MSNSKNFKELRERCQVEYEAGKTDFATLAREFNVAENTVRGWVRKGDWKTIKEKAADLEKLIEGAELQAYLNALLQYNANPADTNLQSLVGLLKSRQKKLEPSKELNEHIVKFLDQTTDYMVEQGLEGLLKQYQAIVHDLAEYLRVKNG
jgi:hypothetical protein